MNCDFKEENGRIVCQKCGFSMSKSDKPVVRNCCHEEYPNIMSTFSNFIGSAKKCVMDGAKLVSDIDYDNRLDICNGNATGEVCLFFDNNRCKKCGCVFAAKLRLSTESCPIGKWGPINT